MSTLRFESVEKSLNGRLRIDAMSAELPLDRVTFVVGPSGAGKSLLCRLGVGLLRPDRGRIFLLDAPVHALPERELLALRRRVPYLVQGPALLDERTVEENVALASPDRKRSSAREALERLGIGDLSRMLPHQLGPGLQKRVALARALVARPQAMVLDEPTTGLDAEAADTVLEALRSLRSEGLGAVVVSHDYEALGRLADAVLVISAGRVIFHGTPEAFAHSQLPEVRALTSAD